MRITRRLFTQLLAASLTLPRKLLGWSRDNAAGTGAVADPSPRRSMQRVDRCYVYNPGIDIAGTQWLTFGTINVIKGGVVTCIETAKESIPSQVLEDSVLIEFYSKKRWDDPGPVGEGWIKEDDSSISWYRMKDSRLTREAVAEHSWKVVAHNEERWVHLTEKRDVVVHPASEIFNALSYDRAYNYLVRIKEWDDKQVDLKGVNEMIAGKTLKERARALRALPTAWRMTSALRPIALRGTQEFETNRREELAIAITGTLGADTWQKESAILLDINLGALRKERRLAEEAWDTAHPESMRPSYRDRKAYEEYIKRYEEQILKRLRAFITERYPLEY